MIYFLFVECQSKYPCIVTDNITHHGQEKEDLFDAVVFKVMNFRTDHVSTLPIFQNFIYLYLRKNYI